MNYRLFVDKSTSLQQLADGRQNSRFSLKTLCEHFSSIRYPAAGIAFEGTWRSGFGRKYKHHVENSRFDGRAQKYFANVGGWQSDADEADHCQRSDDQCGQAERTQFVHQYATQFRTGIFAANLLQSVSTVANTTGIRSVGGEVDERAMLQFR